MSKPNKLLKKIIIAVFCEDKLFRSHAKIGVFMNNLLEKPVLVFDQYSQINPLYEEGIANEIKKLMTDNYRWELIFSHEIKVLELDDRKVYFIDPKNYANMNDLQYQF